MKGGSRVGAAGADFTVGGVGAESLGGSDRLELWGEAPGRSSTEQRLSGQVRKVGAQH